MISGFVACNSALEDVVPYKFNFQLRKRERALSAPLLYIALFPERWECWELWECWESWESWERIERRERGKCWECSECWGRWECWERWERQERKECWEHWEHSFVPFNFLLSLAAPHLHGTLVLDSQLVTLQTKWTSVVTSRNLWKNGYDLGKLTYWIISVYVTTLWLQRNKNSQDKTPTTWEQSSEAYLSIRNVCDEDTCSLKIKTKISKDTKFTCMCSLIIGYNNVWTDILYCIIY